MKYTVVPAQVTTVEDRIAGNLGVSQLLLLVTPVFLDSAFYIILPPSLHFAFYKIVFMIVLLLICCVFAIRIKGKIILHWVVIIARYNFRPRYYLFNKNSLVNREQSYLLKRVSEEAVENERYIKSERLPQLTTADKIRLEELLTNPAADISYEVKKGGLSVHLKKIKQES